MKKLLSFAVITSGLALVTYGASASKVTCSDFAQFFTGSPIDKTMWLLIVGSVLAAVGLVGLLSESKPA
jgi:hypothetical protein